MRVVNWNNISPQNGNANREVLGKFQLNGGSRSTRRYFMYLMTKCRIVIRTFDFAEYVFGKLR